VRRLSCAPTTSYRSCRTCGSGQASKAPDYLGRIDDLRKVDAAVRFVSFEPLLGSVACADLSGIQWAIVGGESGPRSRPMAEQSVAEIETAFRKAKTAFFFKQWGGARKKSTGRQYRGRTFDEMPRAVAMP
jgi:protein gp37